MKGVCVWGGFPADLGHLIEFVCHICGGDKQHLAVVGVEVLHISTRFPSGARDKTQRAIEGALSIPHDFSCVHVHMRKLRDKLSSSLQMSSQIFYHPSITQTVNWDGSGGNVLVTVTSLFSPQR